METMTITDDYTIRYKRYESKDPRLGRNVRHDSRSLSFQVEAAPLESLKSIRHQRYIPILDQGNLGSCTGNAAVGCLGTGTFWTSSVVATLQGKDAIYDEQYAVKVYSDATKLDPYVGTYPPADTGSDGLSVAQVLRQRGLISGFQHATSLEAALTALSRQPVLIGSEWRHDMFRPQPDGQVVITGSVDGGHEYVLDELDVDRKIVWLANSWSTRWALQGRAYLTWDALGELLDADGDCTVLTPLNQPAPTPTPPTPPAPPSPVPTDQKKAEFLRAYNEFSAAVVKFTS